MKKILKTFESKNYFQKQLEKSIIRKKCKKKDFQVICNTSYEKASVKYWLLENKENKNYAIWKSKGKEKDEKLVLLEYERKKLLQKQDFFKNEKKALNFLKNNTSNKNLSQDLLAIKYYNIRKEKERKKAFILLSSKI